MNINEVITKIVIPIITAVIGFFAGKSYEVHKAKSKINGSNNTVVQNSNIHQHRRNNEGK